MMHTLNKALFIILSNLTCFLRKKSAFQTCTLSKLNTILCNEPCQLRTILLYLVIKYTNMKEIVELFLRFSSL